MGLGVQAAIASNTTNNEQRTYRGEFGAGAYKMNYERTLAVTYVKTLVYHFIGYTQSTGENSHLSLTYLVHVVFIS